MFVVAVPALCGLWACRHDHRQGDPQRSSTRGI